MHAATGKRNNNKTAINLPKKTKNSFIIKKHTKRIYIKNFSHICTDIARMCNPSSRKIIIKITFINL